ncbi:MAG: ATP-binding cassette domain-containing protein [Gammaproteobacteria bacterium]|nr:ATP-binding cassette domain-containing protein [Gammaproteobacteria bacterium]
MPPSDSPARRPASRDLRQLRLLWQYLAPHKPRLVGAAVALVLAACSVLAIGQGLRLVIDLGIERKDPAFLDSALAGMGGVILLLAIATYARFYLVTWLGERVTADIRRGVFNHLLDLPPAFFEDLRTGEVISRLTNDTTLIEAVVGSSASFALRNLFIMAGGLVMLAVTSLKLTGLVLVGIPLVFLPIIVLGKRVRRLSRQSQDRIADVAAYVDETLHEIRTVQAYTHEAADRAHFGSRVEAQFDTARARIKVRALMVALVMFLAFTAIGAILWVGGHDVLEGRISPGALSAFVFYAVLVASAVGAIAEVMGDLQRAAGAAERLIELLSVRPTIAPPRAGELLTALPSPLRGEVALEAVTFSYPARPDTSALQTLSLSIASGEKVALVGPSGAGKTTLFQLLLRFHDPDQGRVLIDGVDVKRLDPSALRRAFALVPQEPVIFATSVAENVRYGRPDATDAEVRAACEAAYASEFIARLPEGLETPLGERGVRLSGGQRQRLAIARAVLSRRPILLLDEATSNLDAESERLVQLAMTELMKDHTTLIIAHRLATVQNVDRILVLDHGQLVEQGTHAELVAQQGLYARLAALQFGLS